MKNKKIVFIAGFVLLVGALVMLFSGSDEAADQQANQCSGQNLLDNGNFETLDASIGAINEFAMNTLAASPLNWDVFNSLPSSTGDDSSWRATEGTGIELQYIAESDELIDGKHVVELDSTGIDETNSSSNSAMAQTVQLEEGEYDLSFAYRARTDVVDDNIIEVLLDGSVIHTQNNTNQNWQKVDVNLGELTSGEHTLGFRAAGLENTLGGLIDSVVLGCEE